MKRGDADLEAARKFLGQVENWIVAFHAQQAAEKYLKAFLIHHRKPFRKTHDVLELLENCINVDEKFEKLEELPLEKLTKYAVDFRYPTIFEPTDAEAAEAIEIAEEIRRFVINKMDVHEDG